MRYRKTCTLYDEVNMGNPGNVPWCSDKGLEPDCENCTRPDKTNADRIRAMTDEELRKWFCQYRECDDWHCPFCNNDAFGAERCSLRDWLKSPMEVDDG